MGDADEKLLHEHYELDQEHARLDRPLGIVEYERTQEILLRHLPNAPARIADIGAGPGRYAIWLASLGCEVEARDLVPLHIEHLSAEATSVGSINAKVGDARNIDLDDASVDAVLLLGPLYHLTERQDRLRALREAARIVIPGGPIFVAAISRWSPRLHAEVARSYHRLVDGLHAHTLEVERTGLLPPIWPGAFLGYCHRPQELADEIQEADLDLLDLVSVEGIAFALSDLQERLADAADREIVFAAARELERIPELLGIGPHLLATARRTSVT